jgi:hypothetical protein
MGHTGGAGRFSTPWILLARRLNQTMERHAFHAAMGRCAHPADVHSGRESGHTRPPLACAGRYPLYRPDDPTSAWVGHLP